MYIDHVVMSIQHLLHWIWRFLCPVCSLDKALLAFTLLHFVLQGQTYLLLQVSLDFLLLHSNPHIRKRTFFGGCQF